MSNLPEIDRLQDSLRAYGRDEKPTRMVMRKPVFDRLLAEYRLLDPTEKYPWAPLQMFGVFIECEQT